VGHSRCLLQDGSSARQAESKTEWGEQLMLWDDKAVWDKVTAFVRAGCCVQVQKANGQVWFLVDYPDAHDSGDVLADQFVNLPVPPGLLDRFRGPSFTFEVDELRTSCPDISSVMAAEARKAMADGEGLQNKETKESD
jgi:hypothetical protein